ncbi:hypothetical protein V8E36_003284 [Tilletia maclaganii]
MHNAQSSVNSKNSSSRNTTAQTASSNTSSNSTNDSWYRTPTNSSRQQHHHQQQQQHDPAAAAAAAVGAATAPNMPYAAYQVDANARYGHPHSRQSASGLSTVSPHLAGMHMYGIYPPANMPGQMMNPEMGGEQGGLLPPPGAPGSNLPHSGMVGLDGIPHLASAAYLPAGMPMGSSAGSVVPLSSGLSAMGLNGAPLHHHHPSTAMALGQHGFHHPHHPHHPQHHPHAHQQPPSAHGPGASPQASNAPSSAPFSSKPRFSVPHQPSEEASAQVVAAAAASGIETADPQALQHPSYIGHIKTSVDAILLLSACDHTISLGKAQPGSKPEVGDDGLPRPRRVTRRLLDGERASLIHSGSIFVWDEKEAGMRRWTDGRCWSASRVSGCFLTYRELEGKKKTPAQAALIAAQTGKPNTGGTSNTYKTDGLIKQSFSITTLSGRKLHIISYYTKRDVRENRLRKLQEDPHFRRALIASANLFANNPGLTLPLPAPAGASSSAAAGGAPASKKARGSGKGKAGGSSAASNGPLTDDSDIVQWDDAVDENEYQDPASRSGTEDGNELSDNVPGGGNDNRSGDEDNDNAGGGTGGSGGGGNGGGNGRGANQHTVKQESNASKRKRSGGDQNGHSGSNGTSRSDHHQPQQQQQQASNGPSAAAGFEEHGDGQRQYALYNLSPPPSAPGYEGAPYYAGRHPTTAYAGSYAPTGDARQALPHSSLQPLHRPFAEHGPATDNQGRTVLPLPSLSSSLCNLDGGASRVSGGGGGSAGGMHALPPPSGERPPLRRRFADGRSGVSPDASSSSGSGSGSGGVPSSRTNQNAVPTPRPTLGRRKRSSSSGELMTMGGTRLPTLKSLRSYRQPHHQQQGGSNASKDDEYRSASSPVMPLSASSETATTSPRFGFGAHGRREYGGGAPDEENVRLAPLQHVGSASGTHNSFPTLNIGRPDAASSGRCASSGSNEARSSYAAESNVRVSWSSHHHQHQQQYGEPILRSQSRAEQESAVGALLSLRSGSHSQSSRSPSHGGSQSGGEDGQEDDHDGASAGAAHFDRVVRRHSAVAAADEVDPQQLGPVLDGKERKDLATTRTAASADNRPRTPAPANPTTKASSSTSSSSASPVRSLSMLSNTGSTASGRSASPPSDASTSTSSAMGRHSNASSSRSSSGSSSSARGGGPRSATSVSTANSTPMPATPVDRAALPPLLMGEEGGKAAMTMATATASKDGARRLGLSPLGAAETAEHRQTLPPF